MNTKSYDNPSRRKLNVRVARPAAILLATVVAIITSTIAANAVQTITTPNAAFVSYNLAAGASSAQITPATNRSVLVMGCSTVGANGVGQVSLLSVSSGPILWVGLESFAPAGVTSGNSGTAGTHIVYIDQPHAVDVQVAGIGTIRVHNGAAATVAGNVTLIW